MLVGGCGLVGVAEWRGGYACVAGWLWLGRCSWVAVVDSLAGSMASCLAGYGCL